MAFEAQFPSKCEPDDVCIIDSGGIQPGDWIVKIDTNRYAHAVCYADAQATTHSRAEVLATPVLREDGSTAIVYDEVKDRSGDRPTRFSGTTLEDMGF